MPRAARLALLFACFLWAVSFVATKVALETTPPLLVVSLRLIISALCFLPWLVKGTSSRLEPPLIVARLFGLSLLGTGLHYGIQTVGLQYTTATNASLFAVTGLGSSSSRYHGSRRHTLMNYGNFFRVQPGGTVNLESVDAGFKPEGLKRKEGENEFKRLINRLRELQHQMYAEDQHSLLIVLQGRDAAGKDGTIRHVFGPLNPQGCRVASFKVPSKVEAAHDFLWRCHLAAPARGQVGIFNRSHYEDVLVVRVHDLVSEETWSKRYDHINNFEALLHDKGTTVLKFYLHIDRDEQLERFGKRISDPARNWKISDADYSERPYWDQYTEAFEDALSRCSTENAPWFVIPANRKWFRNLAIASIVVEAMEGLNMKYPEPSVDMDEIRRKYHQAENAD